MSRDLPVNTPSLSCKQTTFPILIFLELGVGCVHRVALSLAQISS